MNIFGTSRAKRRLPMELQLTAMIDIFSMIVIFMILGTIFNTAELPLPPGMVLPKSSSKENANNAPSVVIAADQVKFSASPEPVPMSAFRENDEGRLSQLSSALKAYVDSVPKEAKANGVFLNVMADQNAPYEDVFSVVRVFRKAGFEALVFVATGEGK